MAGPPPPTMAAVFAKADYREQRYTGLINEAISGWSCSLDEQRWLSAVFGMRLWRHRDIAAEPIMSDLQLRAHSTRTLIDMMIAHWRSRPPGRCYFSITLFDEIGVTLDRRPEVALGSLKKKVGDAIRTAPLSAVVQIELQAIKNYPRRSFGRALLFHAHAIGWTDDPAWIAAPEKSADAWAAKINAKRSWSSRLGGKPAKINCIIETQSHIARVAAYMTKPPHDVKNRMPNHKRPGEFMMMDTEAFPADLALRIGEGLSQITFNDAIFSVRADQIGRTWRKAVLDWHRSRIARLRSAGRRNIYEIGDRADIARQWAELRGDNGSRHYRTPFRFLASGERPTSIHPPEAEADATETDVGDGHAAAVAKIRKSLRDDVSEL